MLYGEVMVHQDEVQQSSLNVIPTAKKLADCTRAIPVKIAVSVKTLLFPQMPYTSNCMEEEAIASCSSSRFQVLTIDVVFGSDEL